MHNRRLAGQWRDNEHLVMPACQAGLFLGAQCEFLADCWERAEAPGLGGV